MKSKDLPESLTASQGSERIKKAAICKKLAYLGVTPPWTKHFSSRTRRPYFPPDRPNGVTKLITAAVRYRVSDWLAWSGGRTVKNVRDRRASMSSHHGLAIDGRMSAMAKDRVKVFADVVVTLGSVANLAGSAVS